MLKFLGVAADRRLLDEHLVNLPASEQYRQAALATPRHDRLFAARSLLVAATVVGAPAVALYGSWQILSSGGGAIGVIVAAIVLAAIGILSATATLIAAYDVTVAIDERTRRLQAARDRDWLAAINPYPRFSVCAVVLDDASICVQRILHRPIHTANGTFTFARETEAEKTYHADAPAQLIAATVEDMRHETRIETDRIRLWQAAFNAHTAALASAERDKQRLAAQRTVAVALSEHINRSLLVPPLAE